MCPLQQWAQLTSVITAQTKLQKCEITEDSDSDNSIPNSEQAPKKTENSRLSITIAAPSAIHSVNHGGHL